MRREAAHVSVNDTLVVGGCERVVTTVASHGIGRGRTLWFLFEDRTHLSVLASQNVVRLEVGSQWPRMRQLAS